MPYHILTKISKDALTLQHILTHIKDHIHWMENVCTNAFSFVLCCSGSWLLSSRQSDSLWWIGPDEDLHPVRHLSPSEAPGILWPWAGGAAREPGTVLSSSSSTLFLRVIVHSPYMLYTFLRMSLQAECPLTGRPGSCRAPSWQRCWGTRPQSGSTRSPWLHYRIRAGTLSTWAGRRVWSGETVREDEGTAWLVRLKVVGRRKKIRNVMLNVCFYRWRSHVRFPVNLSGQVLLLFLHRQVSL